MADLDRRSTLALLAALTGATPLAAATRASPGRAFSWEGLQAMAARRAAAPFRSVPPVAAAARIDYDAAGGLRFREDRTLAGGIRLFPLTAMAPVPVAINLVEQGRARPVVFSPDLFATRGGGTGALGIAGFRAITPGRDSDWLAFLGASYFRAAGAQDQYGLSARAIAIDTGITGQEEFPVFTDFWIEPRGANAYLIHALLDGPSVTGAFRFDCRFAAGVVQDVSSVLFFRRPVTRLGVAPATSMFWYGEGRHDAATDWRPEIHDSDGLALATGSGERIWRPLVNPPRETIDSFADRNPRGFGLIQRDRDFANYQDDGAFYDRRPNLWIEPKGAWGPGAVSLFAFPTTGETTDNVVAFWTPEAPVKRGTRLAFDYRLTWNSADPAATAPSRAIACRFGTAGRPGHEPVAGARKLVVDFLGDALVGLGRDSGVTVEAGVAHGTLLASAAYPVVGQRGLWRATLDVAPSGPATDPATVRLFLRRGDQALSETIIVPVG
ncbi:glucan biosynthesis protein [Sphingomonas solaris]|uniref:Glucan biosynthesis protein D n=1 Tax=Alterirhizorhabdus solaris TaxID=2529389 RepID=A0A558R7C8_9SPHN|nr:glucan biosynthesis protein D [Sphingomonas solaris]TVV75293.1 glucan biosynthesis protein D [Sphingomonas solaris]